MVLGPGLYWPWASTLNHVRDLLLGILYFLPLTSWRLILRKVKSSVSVSSSFVACGKHFLISETVASGASSAASSAAMFWMDVM